MITPKYARLGAGVVAYRNELGGRVVTYAATDLAACPLAWRPPRGLAPSKHRQRIAQKAVEDTVLRARFDGTIAATYVENFQNVRAKQPIVRLLNVSSIEIVIHVPESLISLAPYTNKIICLFDAFPDHEITAAAGDESLAEVAIHQLSGKEGDPCIWKSSPPAPKIPLT